MLKTRDAVPDLRVEYLCENGGLVYNALAYGVGYCNINLNKLEKKKKPCDMSLAGLSHGLRPIGLNLLAFTNNDNRIIREGQGLSPLLSYILAPSPQVGGAHGNCFSSRISLSRKEYVQLAICACGSASVDHHPQAVDYCLVLAHIYCVIGKKKGQMRQHPALIIFSVLSDFFTLDDAANIILGFPVEGGVFVPRFDCLKHNKNMSTGQMIWIRTLISATHCLRLVRYSDENRKWVAELVFIFTQCRGKQMLQLPEKQKG